MVVAKMKAFIVLVILAAVGGIAQAFPDRKPSTRIISGKPASDKQFPWHVYLRPDYITAKTYCGGTIISNRWVISAAHCTFKASSIELHFGSNNINNMVQTMISKKWTEHPKYNPNNLNNDVSLINLPEELKFTDAIKPIQLLSRKQASGDFNKQEGIIAGFGYTTNENPSISEILMYATVRVITNSECLAIYGPEIVIDSTLCAHGLGDLSQSTCSGDSGGSLIIKEDGSYTQIGVISFVAFNGCGLGHPSGFARLSFFLDWISEQTGIPVRD